MTMKPLIDLLNLPPTLAAITRTSDGFYLGMAYGDIGFNVFLGQPSFHPGPGKDRSRLVWKRLGFGAKRQALRAAKALSLDLGEVLR